MRQVLVALTLLAPVAGAAVAQDEAALRRAFEGRTVTVKIAMPGTFGDDAATSVSVPSTPKTKRERVTGEFVDGVLIRYTRASD